MKLTTRARCFLFGKGEAMKPWTTIHSYTLPTHGTVVYLSSSGAVVRLTLGTYHAWQFTRTYQQANMIADEFAHAMRRWQLAQTARRQPCA
jgi:hypothetical protein